MISMPVEIYTDGSSLGNPGPSGLAYIIRYWETTNENEMPTVKEIEVNQGFRLSTNNRMEMMAGLLALKAVIKNIKEGLFECKMISLTADSTYFVDAINKRWIDRWAQNNWMTSGFRGSAPQPVKNKDIWEEIIIVIKEIQDMNIILNLSHVLGHNGNEFNEKADKLAVDASKDTTKHIVDEAYERISQNNQTKKTNFGFKTYR
jgi:ribonuclease HI